METSTCPGSSCSRSAIRFLHEALERSARNRLLADVSLWSADLANLQTEIARVSALADSFHLDVADAHFVRGLLFFRTSSAPYGPIRKSRSTFI